MLRRVADDGHQDDADEGLRKPDALRHGLDGPDEDLRKDRNADGRSEQDRDRHRQFCLRLRFLAGRAFFIQGPVRDEREHELHAVDQQHQHRDDDAQPFVLGGQALLRHRMCEDGRDRKTEHGEQQHARRDVHGVPVEFLRLELQTADQHRHAEHQQDIADDGARQRSLHDVEHAFLHRDKGDDQLGRIAEGRIEKPADLLPTVAGDRLCALAHEAGQRDDRERAAREHERIGKPGELADDRDR